MRILITGGHLTPALAVIQALPKNAEILYIGRKHALEGDSAESLEYQTITSLKIPFEEIKTGRIQRRFTRHTLPTLLRIPTGFWQAQKIIRKFKPDVVLSFGSYVSIPIGITAYRLGIPLILHEQTLHAGLSNRLLTFFAQKVCISWDSSRKYFPENKTVLTGNPMPVGAPKEDIKSLLDKDDKPLISVVGGSQGSHVINSLFLSILPTLLEKYRILHQTGDAKEFNDFDKLNDIRNNFSKDMQKRYILFKFINTSDIEYVIKKSKLVVTRGGINTIQMLLLENKPSLVIPLLSSQKNDQFENAYFLKKMGLAEVLEQDELTPESILSSIHAMMNNIKQYICQDREKFISLHESAASRIVNILEHAKKSSKDQKTS